MMQTQVFWCQSSSSSSPSLGADLSLVEATAYTTWCPSFLKKTQSYQMRYRALEGTLQAEEKIRGGICKDVSGCCKEDAVERDKEGRGRPVRSVLSVFASLQHRVCSTFISQMFVESLPGSQALSKAREVHGVPDPGLSLPKLSKWM